MTSALRRLATLYGIDCEYVDAWGAERSTPDEALYAILCALGAHVAYPPDVDDALRARERELAARRVPRVVVAWDGELSVPIRFASAEEPAYAITLRTEDGTESRFAAIADPRMAVSPEELGGARAVVYRVPVASGLAHGYHELSIEVGGAMHRVHAISAPRRAWTPEDERLPRKCWGVFAPVHALRSKEGLGVGDLGDLAELVSEVYRRGGRVVGTLPLLAAYLRDRVEPSPYKPVSKLFWNELYLDVRALAAYEGAPDAEGMLHERSFTEAARALDRARYVDPARVMALKRPILERLAEGAFARGGPAGISAELARDPLLDAYARFRAVEEARREPFHAWPERLRSGDLRASDCDPRGYRYHAYVQVRLREQLESLCARSRCDDGLGLYLDLPLGVHPDGFDVFRERGLFARDVSVGAPPDDCFRHGQSWGFPPLLPEALRADGYSYVRRSLAASMRHAGMLRLDHVMGLHRVFFVPHGMEAEQGGYVRYPAEELEAVVALESHRHRTLVVGEDLGTVPPEVRDGMARHGLDRMFVFSCELDRLAESERELCDVVPHDALCALNTHELPTFEAFVEGHDLEASVAHGHLEEHEAREVLERRRRALERLWARVRRHEGAPLDAGVLLRHLLEELGASDARVVLATLEDLWLEELPQNEPGAGPELPSFRRRLAHALPELFARADVTEALGALDRARK